MRLALCNEVLREMAFDEQCRFARAVGYRGLELAPYTVDPEPHLMTGKKRRSVRRTAEDAGVPIAGLHWLLVTPKGLSITTDDAGIRDQTIDIMRRLIELCADVGGEYLVHGSPGQRRLPDDPAAAAEARIRGIDAWATIAAEAKKAGVTYCIEALAEPQANFVNSVAEAAGIVDEIGSEFVRTMLDCSAASRMESVPVAALVEKWLPSGHIAHVQVNDKNRRGPGQGDDDLRPVIDALKRYKYDGWIGVEPFIYEPDGPATAAFAAGYMRGLGVEGI